MRNLFQFAFEGTLFRPWSFIVVKDYFAFELRVTFSLLREPAAFFETFHYKTNRERDVLTESREI